MPILNQDTHEIENVHLTPKEYKGYVVKASQAHKEGMDMIWDAMIGKKHD